MSSTNEFQRRTATESADAFRRLYDRAASRIVAVDDANERANAAIKTLPFLYPQRAAFGDESNRFSLERDATQIVEIQALINNWEQRFDAFVAEIRSLISNVENAAERAYLRRIFLEKALAFQRFEPLKVDRLADELLAEIDEEEERQNALYAYSKTLAARVAELENFAETREKTLRLAEELDDLRQFEEVVATLASAVLFNEPNERATIANEIQTNADDSPESADAATFCADVRSELAELESDAGFLRFFGALPEAFDARQTFRSAKLRRAFEVETRRRLAQLVAMLDADKNADGEPLDEADRETLQAVAETIELADSPFVLEDGDFWRGFATRFRRFDVLTTIFNALAEADSLFEFLETVPNAFERPSALNRNLRIRRAFLPRSNEFYAAEKEKTLDAARRLAADPAFNESPRQKVETLLELAQIEFLYGDATNGKNVCREILSQIARLSTPVERAAIYRRLVEIHLDAALKKAAKKLAALLVQSLDEIEPEDVRDREKVDAFSTLLRADVDDETISAFADSLDSPAARFAVESEFEFRQIFRNPSRDAAETAADPTPENAAAFAQTLDVWRDELRRGLDSTFEKAAEIPETDAEIFALVEFGKSLNWQTFRLTLDAASVDSAIQNNDDKQENEK